MSETITVNSSFIESESYNHLKSLDFSNLRLYEQEDFFQFVFKELFQMPYSRVEVTQPSFAFNDFDASFDDFSELSNQGFDNLRSGEESEVGEYDFEDGLSDDLFDNILGFGEFNTNDDFDFGGFVTDNFSTLSLQNTLNKALTSFEYLREMMPLKQLYEDRDYSTEFNEFINGLVNDQKELKEILDLPLENIAPFIEILFFELNDDPIYEVNLLQYLVSDCLRYVYFTDEFEEGSCIHSIDLIDSYEYKIVKLYSHENHIVTLYFKPY